MDLRLCGVADRNDRAPGRKSRSGPGADLHRRFALAGVQAGVSMDTADADAEQLRHCLGRARGGDQIKVRRYEALSKLEVRRRRPRPPNPSHPSSPFGYDGRSKGTGQLPCRHRAARQADPARLALRLSSIRRARPGLGVTTPPCRIKALRGAWAPRLPAESKKPRRCLRVRAPAPTPSRPHPCSLSARPQKWTR